MRFLYVRLKGTQGRRPRRKGCRTRTRPHPRAFFVRTLYNTNRSTMDTERKPDPDPKPMPLGNESTDPFSPALPPGSLHERLRQEEEEDVGGEPTPVVDDPKAAPKKE